MKIDKVVMSCDDNPLYFGFWKPISKVWKEKFQITPILLYFGDQSPSDEYGEIIQFEKTSKHPSYLRTLWSRYWYPSTRPDTVFCISDIDMIPMSKSYFTKTIESISNDYYVNLVNHFPMPSCYHVATGKLFKQALDLPDSFEESLDILCSANAGLKHPEFDFSQWGSDEAFATQKISQKTRDGSLRLITIDRKHYEGRLDRGNWSYNIEDVIAGRYIDSHSIRPYEKHQDEIDKLISFIP